MPTYPLKNLKTGETQELIMPMTEYDDWRKENPDWDKDWSKGCAGVGEVGDWQNKLISRNPGWNDVLKKASKAPGSKVKTL
jgi:hypothetical protein|tara:strand:+ start:114 stop:356 length:243 start_codon:yes stop_codon:yes gene_type:complete